MQVFRGPHSFPRGTNTTNSNYWYPREQIFVTQAPRELSPMCASPLKNNIKIKTLFFSFNIGRVFDKATWLWTLAVLLFCTVALQFFAFFENETVDFKQVPVVKWSFCLKTYLSKEAFKEHVVYFANT